MRKAAEDKAAAKGEGGSEEGSEEGSGEDMEGSGDEQVIIMIIIMLMQVKQHSFTHPREIIALMPVY
jgi:hypothetical protein